MKKAITLLLAFFAIGLGMQGATYNLTLNVDNAAAVEVKIDNVKQTLSTGDNTLTYELEESWSYGTLEICATGSYGLEQILMGDSDLSSGISTYTNYIYYLNANDTGKTMTVKTFNKSSARTASFSIYSDTKTSQEGLKLILTGTNREIDISAGMTKTVAYDPIREKQLQCVNGAVPFYELTMDGVDKNNYEYGNVTLTLEPNCKISLKAVYPSNLKYTVSFEFGGTSGASALTSVTLDDEEQDISGGSFTVAAGSKVTMQFNTSDYNIKKFEINGETVSSTSYYSFYPRQNTKFSITADPHGPFTATIKADPAKVSMFEGYSEYGSPITLDESGVTVVNMDSRSPNVAWKAKDGYQINSVTLDGVALSSDSKYAPLNEDVVLVIDASEIVYDNLAMIWIDDATLPIALSCYDNSYKPCGTFNTGYNEFRFYAGMMPLKYISWYGGGADKGKMYLDDVELPAGQYGSSRYNIDMKDGSVLKIFLVSDDEPASYKVTFDVDEALVASLMKDVIVPVTGSAEETVFAGTRFDLRLAEGKSANVLANDVPLEADGDGVYSFVTDNDILLTVAKDPSTGVDAVINGANVSDGCVYTINGIKVGEDLKNLPAGLYIKNGKKVIIR